MPRGRKLPKRLPPIAKEISGMVKRLTTLIPEIAWSELDSQSLSKARQALIQVKKKKESITNEQQPENIEAQSERTSEQDTSLPQVPAPDAPGSKPKRKKEKLDMSLPS